MSRVAADPQLAAHCASMTIPGAELFAGGVTHAAGSLTPTRLGECMISAEYARSDKRKFFMPCPCCGVEIVFEPDVRQQVDSEASYGPASATGSTTGASSPRLGTNGASASAGC